MNFQKMRDDLATRKWRIEQVLMILYGERSTDPECDELIPYWTNQLDNLNDNLKQLTNLEKDFKKVKQSNPFANLLNSEHGGIPAIMARINKETGEVEIKPVGNVPPEIMEKLKDHACTNCGACDKPKGDNK